MKNLSCPECSGDGNIECSECGVERECDHCRGTGYDPEVVDLDRWLAGRKKFLKRWGGAVGMFEEGQRVGLETFHRNAAIDVRNYLREEKE